MNLPNQPQITPKQGAKKPDFLEINMPYFYGCLGLIVVGFTIMATETAEYGFGPRALTIGPLFLLAGFVFAFFVIFKKAGK